MPLLERMHPPKSLNIFTIPASAAFLDTLAEHVLRILPSDPILRAQSLILLPTQRACAAFRQALITRAGGAVMALPRIVPLGELGEAEALPEGWGVECMETLPPAIGRTERTALLAQWVRAKEGEGKYRITNAQDVKLAEALGAFFDVLQREEIDYAQLTRLVPEAFASHWQQTVAFLDIVAVHWPKLLAEMGRGDPITLRNHLLRGLARQWQASPPAFPIIIAGSTGSQPATAALLHTVAELPHGQVVLPALDCAMPEGQWQFLPETHPQYALFKLLHRNKWSRAEVKQLGAHSSSAREVWLRAVFTPAEATHHWHAEARNVPVAALEHIYRINCASLQEEAQVVALALRETLETPGKTAALITQDRSLARMTALALSRFDITIDDSAGLAITQTVAGVFLRLVASMASSQAAPVPLLMLLKHPLAACGLEPADCRRIARKLEKQALRGIRPAGGFAALQHIAKEDAETLRLLDSLDQSAGAFMQAMREREIDFTRLLTLHIQTAQALAATSGERGEARLFAGAEGVQLQHAMEEIMRECEALGQVEPGAYADMLESLLARFLYRPPYGAHPRLTILSPMEARLQAFDRVILAGLNEGSWPPAAEANPWLSRPMMQELGMMSPEQRLSQSAQDFFQACLNKEVILTRAEKVEGAETLPSRFLLRMEAFSACAGLPGFPEGGWRDWVGTLQPPPSLAPLAPPSPTPPLEARPTKLSVTAIEKWMRDPYGIYAANILRLKALDPLDQEPDAAHFGNLLHEILAEFTHLHPETLPHDALAQLLLIGQKHTESLMDRPSVERLWWPKFEAIAAWFIAEEQERRARGGRVLAECAGEYTTGNFTLTARMDRLEKTASGWIVADYKTGAVPEWSSVKQGISSQLALEALMLARGGVNAASGASVAALEYWKLLGQSERNEIASSTEVKDLELEQLIHEAEAGLRALIAAFQNPDTPYLVTPDSAIAPRYNDYAHLERAEEWEEG